MACGLMLYLEKFHGLIEKSWMDRPNPGRKTPVNLFKKVPEAQNTDKPNVTDSVPSLRTDMVPFSNIEPARENPLGRDTLRLVVGLLLGLVIVGMILFTALGPGRPILEQNLVILAHKGTPPTFTPTITASPTRVPPTSTPVTPTNTITASPTPEPTRTQVVRGYISPTAIIYTPIPTVPECRQATSITLSDVGQTLCVQGVVLETITNPTNFMVIFSNKQWAFYWVSYDLVWSKVEKNTCYQTHGKIEQIGNSPVLVFNYNNLPEACP
jgi:hypothetical protein